MRNVRLGPVALMAVIVLISGNVGVVYGGKPAPAPPPTVSISSEVWFGTATVRWSIATDSRTAAKATCLLDSSAATCGTRDASSTRSLQSYTTIVTNLAPGARTFNVSVPLKTGPAPGTTSFTVAQPSCSVTNLRTGTRVPAIGNDYGASVGSSIVVANPGDTLRIAGRCYSQRTTSGTAGFTNESKSLTLEGSAGTGATLDGNAARVVGCSTTNGSGVCRTLDLSGAFTVVIRDLAITGGAADVGGAIRASAGVTLRLEGQAAVVDNSSGSGGGIAVDGATLELTGATSIARNRATVAGGGIYVLGGGTLLVGGSAEISANTAPLGGGVFATGATVRLAGDSVVTGNTAGGWSEPGRGNPGGGGGIAVEGGALEITGGSAVRANRAADGGGLFAYKAALVRVGGSARLLDNSAGSGGGAYLGAFDPNGGVVSTFEGASSVRSNRSATDGGGVYAIGGTVTLQESAEISGNTTAGAGGGLHLQYVEMLMAGSPSIRDNSAGQGGGIALWQYSTSYPPYGIELSAGSIEGNRARDGGGIYAIAGTLALTGTLSVRGNSASEEGGGVYLTPSAGSFTIAGAAEVTANTAAIYGGGLYAATSSGVFLAGSAAVNANEAPTGGGIFLSYAPLVVGGSATVSDNLATDGAGIASSGGSVTLTDGSSVSRNIASDSGGGLYLYAYAGAMVSMGGTASIRDNTAGQAGGAIKALLGPIVMEGSSSVSGNRQRFFAVELPIGGTLTLRDTASISGNSEKTADPGGGVYRGGYGGNPQYSTCASTVTLSGSASISGNNRYDIYPTSCS